VREPRFDHLAPSACTFKVTELMLLLILTMFVSVYTCLFCDYRFRRRDDDRRSLRGADTTQAGDKRKNVLHDGESATSGAMAAGGCRWAARLLGMVNDLR